MLTYRSSNSKVFDINFTEILKNYSPTNKHKHSNFNINKTFNHSKSKSPKKNIIKAQSNRDMFKKISVSKPLKSRLSRLDMMALSQHE